MAAHRGSRGAVGNAEELSLDLRPVAVVGPSGSGKGTSARHLGRRRGLTHLELDAVFHQLTPRTTRRVLTRNRAVQP
jgi:adenylate kinase family enzyme